jgi:ribosomal protein S18 acetylase RimI-like enzyme
VEGLSFRPARADEVDRLADIVNDPPHPGAVIVAGSVDRAIRAGRVMARHGLLVRIETTTVATLEGETIGLMDAGVGRTDPEVTLATVVRFLPDAPRVIGPAGLLRFLRSRPAWSRVQFRHHPGNYVIAELDVAARLRGRGIGAEFLRLAEQRCREAGATRMELSTGIENPAQRLYTRAGFRLVETRTDPAYERWAKSSGRVRMVKDLD